MEKAELVQRARAIKLLICDVDGVLTNGSITLDGHGNEIKSFNVRDGLGMTLLQQTGVRIAIITARVSTVVAARMADLDITDVFQGRRHKLEAYQALLDKYELKDEEVAYVGDDLLDLPVMLRVGLALTVADATAPIREIAHYQSPFHGGSGAVRDICELIMQSKDAWQPIIAALKAGSVPE